jgi:hypothetical protein
MELNKTIFTVMRWLADKDSVSVDELKKRLDQEIRDWSAIKNLNEYLAVYYAYHAHKPQTASTYNNNKENAANITNLFFKESGHDKQDYLDEIERIKVQDYLDEVERLKAENQDLLNAQVLVDETESTYKKQVAAGLISL